MAHNRPSGIVFVAVLMIVFGLAEVMTGFTHHFFGLRIAEGTYASTAIGLLYAVAGLFILSMRRWAAALAIAILITVMIGRIATVVTWSLFYWFLQATLRNYCWHSNCCDLRRIH
jgi:hypothetical protein